MIKLPASPGCCACGLPLHYSDDAARRFVEGRNKELGEHIVVRVGLRRWLVQRHYLALHGLKAQELPSLGFPEIGPEEFVADR